MTVKEVTVQSKFGNHTRPTQIFIETANEFAADVWVEKIFDEDGKRMARGKSLLGMLSIKLTHGDKINIIAEGSDEIEAVDTLAKLVENGFE